MSDFLRMFEPPNRTPTDGPPRTMTPAEWRDIFGNVASPSPGMTLEEMSRQFIRRIDGLSSQINEASRACDYSVFELTQAINKAIAIGGGLLIIVVMLLLFAAFTLSRQRRGMDGVAKHH